MLAIIHFCWLVGTSAYVDVVQHVLILTKYTCTKLEIGTQYDTFAYVTTKYILYM